jgi:very-short-patch-repair endonuclease
VLRRRYDLCYPEFRLIVEYDGRQHAEDIAQWESDLQRREELDDEEYRILVVTARGVFVEPERTIERVRRQLIARGFPGKLPVDEQWREHFRA